MPYEKAVEEVKKEIAQCNANHYKAEQEKKSGKNFKEEFEKICNSKT